MISEQLPPNSIESEEALLGCILADNSYLKEAASEITPADFFIVKNQWIFEAMQRIAIRNESIDFVTLCHELEASRQLDEIGGPVFISHLLNVTPSFLNGASYARIVRSASIDRQLLGIASGLAQSAYDGEQTTDTKLTRIYDQLRSVTIRRNRSQSVGQVAKALYDKVFEWSENPIGENEVRGISLGIRALDKMTGGLHSDDLTVLAARPGVGKTALAIQIADYMATRGLRIMFYSLEMSADRVLRRMASRRARVNFNSIERGTASDDELAHVMRVLLDDIQNLPITINDDNHVTTAMIAAETDRTRPDFIILDNLNILLEPQAYVNESDVKRIGRVSRNLKIIANDLRVPVLVICHMNRKSEDRREKRPILADLRDSGEIEQNADNVLMMYRADLYEDNPKSEGEVEILPRKLRDGDITKAAKLYYKGEIYDFQPLHI